MDCIFCKIVNGDIPAYKVYEDDDVMAFLDISQATKGHTLLIPKKHEKNMYDITDETVSKVFGLVPTIAKALKEAFNPIGLNLVSNTDKPLQSVDHFHVHLVPRYENDEFNIDFINHMESLEKEDYQAVLEKLTQVIKK